MVTVRLFARFKDLAKKDRLTLSLVEPLPLKRFVDCLAPFLPEVVPLLKEKYALIAVNQEEASEDTLVRDGDEVAIMPPFSGGTSKLSSRSWTRIQTEDFSVDQEIARIKAASKRVGGIAVFLGTARDFSEGHAVAKLTYEHYAGMAERILAEIREQAIAQFDIIEASLLHRIGEIPIGGNIVLIVVGAEHRAEAFRACRWCIDQLKATVPIWKKELTPEGEVWVEEHP
jgi:molybdopterin synthase catalytic subunit